MTTEDCKNKIVEEILERGIHSSDPLADPKNWKRKSKYKAGSYTVRVFSYIDPEGSEDGYVLEKNGKLAIVDKSQFEDLVAMDEALPDGISTEDLLIYQAKRIKHIGDYGHLYFNKKAMTVVWVAGDGDGDPDNGHTSFDDIETMFKAVPGIVAVEIADEWAPDEEDWKDLGNYGITVNI